MSLTINAKTYSADSFEKDQVVYKGPAHTSSIKDLMSLSRVEPKPTPSFSGVARAQAKLTRTHALTGVLTPAHDSISVLQHSVPVGASGADIDAICNDLGAFVASASYKDLLKKQLINQ